MIFKQNTYHEPKEVYVWFFPPECIEPVVVGRIVYQDRKYVFNYGRSWLKSPNAISLYVPELPLQSGAILPIDPLEIANCLRDASPDAWGRRVIINQITHLKYRESVHIDFNELTYLLHSGSDRIGALDFQESATQYIPRQEKGASLEELYEATEKMATGSELTPDLARALFHGSSVGGARPKALMTDQKRKMIAKFALPTDTYPIIKAEFIAMRLADKVGIDVAPVQLTQASGKDVLLIERFDRIACDDGWYRKSIVSALTILGLDEMQARYAHYGDLADIIRSRFVKPRATLHELFARMVFNILVGNTDDHARNHAAFWNGHQLKLTPAYDICPQARTGREAGQAMLIYNQKNDSRLVTCLAVAGKFQLTEAEAREMIDHQIDMIQGLWKEICDEACLTKADRDFLWKRQFLNDYAFEDY